MNTDLDFVKQVLPPVYRYRYAVCTLVTDQAEYGGMVKSFIAGGFTTDICEYLAVDNSKTNTADAYVGINRFLKQAQGEYIIICHQDVLLTQGVGRHLLDQRISEMSALDPKWAVLGNAGASGRLYKRLAIKIAYPDGFIDIKGTLPQQVCSIDENFMLLKNEANLALSGDIGGYHMYGLDICMVARLLGYTCYVIDFLLLHNSKGNPDKVFKETVKNVRLKYIRFMKGRYISTTIARFYLSGSVIKNALFDTRVFRRVSKTAEEISWKLGKSKLKN